MRKQLVNKNIYRMILIGLSVFLLSSCNLLNATSGNAPEVEDTGGDGTSGEAIPTQATLAPTLMQAQPTVEGAEDAIDADADLAPTQIPEPTQIGTTVPEEASGDGSDGGEASGGDDAAPVGLPTGDGISINPQIGEPLDAVIVRGDGFAPNETISFYWAKPDGPTGDEAYFELESNDDGTFEIGLLVPPADKWPGGPPAEEDILQLRVKSESIKDFYYWANFLYIKRFDPVTSLVQILDNTEYGYSVELPDGWTWDWNGDDSVNVRFASATGSGSGFIRIATTSDVSAAINAAMPVEAPGTTYTVTDIGSGKYPGKRVEASNGLIVWFLPSGNRTYILSFTDDDGNFYELIALSFTIK